MKSRRQFVKQLIAAGIIINLPLSLTSCTKNKEQILLEQNVLSQNQLLIANYIFLQLFSKDNDNINAKAINTLSHYITILTDTNYNKEDKTYLIQGLNWTEETAQELFQKSFEKLNNNNRLELFNTILQKSWGKSWLSYMLDCTFEALLIDPIYKVNTNQIGWKWLKHQAGLPRPSEKNKYSKLLARKQENIIITNLNQL